MKFLCLTLIVLVGTVTANYRESAAQAGPAAQFENWATDEFRRLTHMTSARSKFFAFRDLGSTGGATGGATGGSGGATGGSVCAPGGTFNSACASKLAPIGISDGSSPYTCGLRNAYAKDLGLKAVVDVARATQGGICCGGVDKKSVCDIDFSSVCATGGTFNAAGAAKNTGVTVSDGAGGTRAPTCQEVMMAMRDEEFKVNDFVFGDNAATFVCSSDKAKASFLEATITATGKKF